MATILFANFPLDGHIAPMRPLARELVRREHDVLWYTGARFRDAVERTGATFVPIERGKDFSHGSTDEVIGGRAGLDGVPAVKWDMKHLFGDLSRGYLKDLEALYTKRPIDVVVGELPNFAITLLAPRTAPPSVGIGMFPLGITSVDTAPFGPGILPNRSLFGRLRNRILNVAIERIVFADVQRYINGLRADLGLPAMRRPFLMEALHGMAAYLQTTVPSFEYPRRDLPQHIKFIGPLLPNGSSDFTPPDWWDELDGDRPVVLVTQGTVAKDPELLMLPALEALREENVLVIVTAPEWSGPEHPPANARIAGFIPYDRLLPKVDVVVSNGGYGGVQFALRHGKPLVVAGLTEDKAEVTARVGWSGVGVNLKTHTPTASAIRGAVRRVLDEPGYRAAAERIAADMHETDGPVAAADEIERHCGARTVETAA